MSIEEVYARAFATAGASAAVVAFLIAGAGVLWRKRLDSSGAGIVGGFALALAWVAAHFAMRGPEVWADVARGGNGWKRALWPIEATERFHVALACAVAGGLVAAAAPRTGRGRTVVRWTARIVTITAIAWLAVGPLADSDFVVIVVCGLFGIAWWAALEESEPSPSGALLPMTAAVCGAGFGGLMVMHYATTLGMVAMCGAGALCVVAIAGTRDPRLTQGPMVCAVIAGGWVWLVVSAWVFARNWPALVFACACLAPLAPAVFATPWLRKRPAWNRWVVQLGIAGLLMGIATGMVLWERHGLHLRWPF